MDKISHIFEGMGFSDEDKARIDEAFSGAVTAKVEELKESVTESTVAELNEANKDYLNEHVHTYFEAVAESAVAEFTTEHKALIESQVQGWTEQSILSGLRDLLESHNVEAPEAKGLAERLAEANTRIDTMIAEKAEHKAAMASVVMAGLIKEATMGLAESQRDKVTAALKDTVMVSEAQFKLAIDTAVASLGVATPASQEPIVENKKPTSHPFAGLWG